MYARTFCFFIAATLQANARIKKGLYMHTVICSAGCAFFV